jgi:hypothetical protein
VIVEIDPRRLTSAAIPAEDQPPLPVDPDRMKIRQSAAQLLEVIAGRHPQVLVGVASSIICNLRNSRLSRSAGMFRDRVSSTKKARSQSSRKLTITRLASSSWSYVPLNGTYGKCRPWSRAIPRLCPSRREDMLDLVLSLRPPRDWRASDGARFEIHVEKARGLHGDATDPIEARLETDVIGNPRWSWRPVNESELARVAALLKGGLTVPGLSAALQMSFPTSTELDTRRAIAISSFPTVMRSTTASTIGRLQSVTFLNQD